jgi:hypothetical protein
MSKYKTITVDAEVFLDDFDDEDIEAEYEARFGNTKHETVWHDLYELRITKSQEAFLAEIDKIVMDRTGRIL